jgi:hypothetical protein
LLLASAFALATGLALLAVGTDLTEPAFAVHRPPPTPTVAPTPGAWAFAVRFYAALDTALATGDTTGLAAVVAPAFVDHTDPRDADIGRGFAGEPAWHWVGTAAAQWAARPGPRLTPVAVLADGDRVVVYLAAGGAGWPGGGVVDVLRVSDGRVAERWELGDSGGLWSPATATPTAVPPVIVFVTVPPVLQTIPAEYLPLFGTATASPSGTHVP